MTTPSEGRLAYLSTKTYTHAQGLSCCFRQWRAKSHCNKLHGYALEVQLTFEADELDENGWVQDFGNLKHIKKFLEDVFDHKTLVAHDDPEIGTFRKLHSYGIADVVSMDRVGCEAFAAFIYEEVNKMLDDRVNLASVEVREHAGNSAIVYLRHQV